jgi:hypothetical protein
MCGGPKRSELTDCEWIVVRNLYNIIGVRVGTTAPPTKRYITVLESTGIAGVVGTMSPFLV